MLKGAAASALYGQEAANGVIMIVTKSGKDGKLQVTANATLEVSNATRVPEIQSSYAPGAGVRRSPREKPYTTMWAHFSKPVFCKNTMYR